MSERRSTVRKSIEIYFNKYVSGRPHLCRSLDLSESGMRLVSPSEPDSPLASFCLALRVPGEAEVLWLWARRVRREGRSEVVEFVGGRPEDRHRLGRFLATAA